MCGCVQAALRTPASLLQRLGVGAGVGVPGYQAAETVIKAAHLLATGPSPAAPGARWELEALEWLKRWLEDLLLALNNEKRRQLRAWHDLRVTAMDLINALDLI